MSETTFRKRCCKIWRQQGAFLFPNVTAGKLSTPNWPDLWLVVRQGDHNWHGWIEFKGEKTKLALAQKLVLRRLAATGVPAIIYRQPNIVEDYEGNILQTVHPTELLQWLLSI